MAYTPTTWVNNTAPALSAANLNNIEDGIDDAHDKLDGIEAGAEVNNISDANATDLTDAGETNLHHHDLSNASGVAAEANGGTGESTYAQGDILYASDANNLSKLPKGTASQVLTMNDGATLPNWENSESGFADPMTTRGDLIVRNPSNVTDRMAVGSAGQVLSTDGVDFTWVTSPFVMPPGVVFPYGGASAPSGYLLCDGAAVSRTTYSTLFAIVGTAFGVGDGSTTFNVPDMQGNVPAGIGGSGITDIGDSGGEQEHTLITAEIPSHNHSTLRNASGSSSCIGTVYSNGDAASLPTSYTGGGGGHNSMQPYIGFKFIIKT